MVVSGSYDKTLKEWDLGSGLCIHTLEGHQDWITCCSFDQNKIVSGSKDKTIRMWDRHQIASTNRITNSSSVGYACIKVLKGKRNISICIFLLDQIYNANIINTTTMMILIAISLYPLLYIVYCILISFSINRG